MNDRDSVSRLVQRVGEGAPESTAELFDVLYKELRSLAQHMMARLSPGQTLQPTALVHEAYVRLVASDLPDFECRQHFVRTAARAMRFVLIDQARRRTTAKRAGKRSEQDPDELAIEMPNAASPEDVLALGEALEALEVKQPRQARLVELRFFAGLKENETAEILGLSRRTVAREWRYVRYWLSAQMEGSQGNEKP